MSVWQDLISIYRGYSAKPEQLKKASLAQWILESGRGTSELARNYLNFAGLKYRDRMAGYATPVTHTGADKVTTTYWIDIGIYRWLLEFHNKSWRALQRLAEVRKRRPRLSRVYREGRILSAPWLCRAGIKSDSRSGDTSWRNR